MKSTFRVWMIALVGMTIFGVMNAYAGTAYTNGRAFLKQGSPTGGGKVYVASNATEPTSGQYKAVTSSTSPAFNVQVAGDATFNYWAVANPGYVFTGWYTAEGALQSSGAAHISKKVTAGQAGASDTHAYADYYASFIKQIQLSFVVPTNGSFTITHCGTEVTPAYSSFTTEGKVVLTALPADGYKLRGWYTTTNGGVTKNYFAFGNSCEPNFTSNTTIGAEFVPDDGKATFWIKGTNQIYDNLTSANTAAASSSSKLIVVVSDGVVGAGTYTISSGVTLLIPYEETYNLMTTPNIKHIPSPNAASKVTSIFRKLTLASGATINVSGNICIGGSIASCNGGSPSSFPTGSVGMLDMSRGGTINLASGSNLYAWGYVKGQDMDQGNNTAASGVGEINAASGATVWEDYQVGEWRGGTASSTIYSNKGSWKFFPFQSYTIQNIEAPVNYAYGSNCKCYWTIFGNGSVYDVKFPLIASSGSLFQLKSGGTVRKWYDPTTDHVCFEMGGTAALDALTLTVMGETVSSSDYYLPIPANLKIILKSGNNLTVSKPMTMHAGSVVEIKSGATLTVNNRVHLFDADDWDTYCMYAYYYRTYYSPSLHFNRGEGTAKTTLEDATVIVDGTVDVKGAYLYSSAHGSNICGNGGGTFKYAALPSNTTMTQCKVLKDNVSVNIRSANLHNDNDTYTKGIASTTFKNVNGRWFTNAASTIKANKTYDFTYISSGDVYGTGGTNKTVAACWSKDKTGLELQDKWANIKTQGCTDWWEGIDDGHLYNWSRNSAWHQYIKTGSTTTGSGEEAVTTDTYVGSDGKMLYKTDCEFVDAGTIDGNCLYPSNKALVNGSLIAVTANTSPDHGYHKSDAASTYYLCFEGCVWHPATKNAENLYTVDGTKYIWFGDKWMAVEYDSGVSLYYSLSATNVKIYYDYVGSAWVLATPVAEVVTSAGTEQVFSLANAITKAKAGGTNVTIRLLKNISGTISYDGTNNCGLDLNGFTLSSSTSGMITVNSATATFIIKDQSAAGTGKVQLSYSANARRYAISVTKGHLVVNSGTISAINTSAYASGNTTVDVGAITVANGHKVTVNGGSIEAISDHNPYGIYLAGATAMATINGGTIEAKTTERSSSVDSPYGIIGAGSIYVNGGTVKATCYRSSSSRGISSSGTFTMTGGSVIATASSTCYGVYAASGSNTTISGGTITSTTTGATSRALYTVATATINGGTLTATAGSSDAKGIYVANGTTTVNAGAVVNATATTKAYGIYYADNTPTVTVNGGAFTVSTTSTTEAYGVYAAKGTGTINDGTFTVTAKTTGAEGMHVETTNTPKLTLNGGKFMVKNSNGSANGTINNTGATLANFSMAGGYFNIAPAGSYVAAGKEVKDVERAKEEAIYDAGYRKKIAGTEHTITWKSYDGNTTFGTTQVEDGQVPVWTGTIPDQSTSASTYQAIGWTTTAKNKGSKYKYAEMPAATADVTYYVYVQTIYAEVTIGTTTTRYTKAKDAWTAAMAAQRATIRLLSNIGKESSIGNMTQMVFNPTNANSVIIMDLNGHSWTMGNNSTAANNTSPFIHVNPTQTGCKLIITDNSALGNGYLMNSWEKTDGALTCIQVSKGELVLQGGALKVKNTASSQYSNGVYVGGANAHFTMTGGTVYSTDGYSPRGVCVGDGYADIASGTVEANSMASEAYALLSYDTVTVSGGATLRATGATGSSYGTYCNGAAAVLNIDSAIIISNAYQTAKGIYSLGGGQTTVDGKSSISATTTTGNGAYALYATGANTKITANDGTYTATSAGNSAYGVFAESSGTAIVNDGSFTVTAMGTTARGVYAQSNGTATVKDGSFNVTSDTHADPSSFGAYAAGGTVNIEDGNFTLNVHKDLSNRNCDLARCGTGVSYLNISGGTFAGDSAYHAVRSFGGETTITGNPVFTAQRGVDAGAWASADGTAKVTIDGGTFYCTDNFALYATTHTYNGKTVVGDMTVLDGKFHTKSSIQPIYSSSGTSYLKIKGGYFTSYTSSNVSNLNNFVVAPSTTTAVESTDPMYASPNDYRYRVNTKFTATWKDMAGNTLKTEQYNRNEIPSYGSEYVPSDGNTYTFTGWSPTPGPIQSDQVYTAQYTKWEVEVYEGENPTPTRFQYFTDAFREAQELPVAKIKVISNVYYSTSLTLNPTEAAGARPLTIDLNNHVVNYTPKTATYALTINKAGCKLIIDDSSVAKGGQFGHRQTANNGATISAIYIQNGELELAGGTIIAQNNNIDASTDNSKGTRAVVGNSGTVFTMTGGKLYAKSRFDARAFNSGGTCTFNATGGTIEATTEYEDSGTKWGNNAYGVVLWNYGTFNMSGTATMNVTAASGALGVYPYGAGGTGYPEVNINGGSINCLTKTGGSSRGVQTYGVRATTNISGGDITANGPAGQYNIEDVTCQDDATVNITGGNFHSSTGANCVGVRVFSGTVTIGGTAFFDSRHGVVVGDWATSPTSTATAYVNGGTFDCSEYVLFAKETTNEYDSKNHYSGTVTGTMYVNGGYFKTASGNNICSTGSQTGRLILHGGYYNETSGTTQKSNITTYKSATTEVSTLSPAITVDGRTYHYQLLTDFNITWLGGDSYSKVTTLKSGTMPTNTDLDGKCFLRNDSAFYFTGWNPTPVGVTGDATYNAEGVYHEASVKVGSAAPIIYDDFDEAWAYAMEQASATITLLTNLTRTSSIVYNPAPANARHTFDLNNFTIKENTNDRLLVVNKSDAKLTITDNSSAKGGCLYKKMNSSANMYTTIIYHGEMILAGGKIYVENTKDDKAWHPALAVHTSVSTDGIFTMTGGTVESQAKYLAYPIYNYATTNISGGTVIANATSGGAALGLYALAGTATISGGTFNVTASTNATGAIVTGWINNDGSITENGVLNITGGTFNVSPTTNNARVIQATGTGKNIGGTIYTAHGIANISGGTFNVTCPPVAAATQIFGAVVDGWRLFDGALPHTMIGESRGEMNISGGTFTIDARDNGTWVANSGNVDLLRSWGTLNVSGGNFTLHQYSTPSAISVFRGKTTVSGNPVFNVYGHTGNAYAVCAGYWTSQNYCDKDAANNLAEAEINGGTFKIITEGQNTNVMYALGQVSAESRDAVADTITAHAGYAMNAKITVNGGEFLGICPNASGKYPIMLNSRVDQVGTYGTAKSEIYVTGGKFKSRKGTEADNTSTGAVNCHNNVGTLLLTGGYYETNGQLLAQKADTCIVTNITSAAIDPEYNNGYRYRIDVDYQVKVTHGAVERKFVNLNKAFEYAKTVANPTITLLKNTTFAGPYTFTPTVANWRGTLNLNNFTITSTTTTDRFFTPAKSDAKLTITDNSGAKGGVWNFVKEYNGALIGIVVDQGELILAGGKLYTENTMSAKSATGVNIWGTSAKFTETGGTLQVKTTSATAEGIRMRGIGEISGGNVTITSDGSYARAFVPAADAGNSKYGSITVSGTPTITVSGAGEVSGVYANVAGTTATISGGTWNISSTTSTAYGVRLSNANTATISGGTFNMTATTTSAYGVYVSNGGSGTVSGGTFTSRTGANKNECFGAFATGTGTTLDITGGTFDVNSADNAGGNINVVRVQPSATVNISGGTFRSGATSGYGLVAFGGVTTVSGTALFEAYTGAYAGSWYQGDGTNDVLATVNLNGGTFNVAGIAIDAMWNTKYENKVYLDSPFSNSIINVNGGRYKTTSGTIVRKKANGADGGTAVLNIAGGYFNEKSGTTFKDQIATYVADTSEINTLDPLLDGIYKYEVAPHYVAKVQTGSTTKYHTTAKAAFDYAKTVANPTITLLDNCMLTEANYTINPGTTWTATLDLNNFTLTPTVDATYGRAFTIGGSKTKFIVTDNSVGQGGQIYYKGNSSVSIIYFVMGANTEMELAGGTLYVENTNASKKAVGFVVDASTARFTQSGGTFTIKGAYGANGYYGGGTATFTGGTMNVDGGSHQAIGLFPQVSTSVLNVSGTFALNVTSSLGDSYGVLVKNSGATGTINGGKFKFNQNTMVAAQLDGSLTINGGYFCEHPSQAGRYKSQINSYKGSKVIMDLDAADAEYIAGYRYLVTDDPVAKVKAGSEVTYYTSVADAITAANDKTNPTVTMLKNATTTQQTISAAMTIDLNGKTVTSTQASSKKGVFSINASGQTVTITDSGTGGKIDHTASYAGYVYGVALAAGTLNVTGGTIYAKNTHTKDTTTYRAYGIYTAASTTLTISDGTIEAECPNNSYALGIGAVGNLTMTGGTVRASATTVAYGVYANNTSTELSDVTVTTNTTGATSIAIYDRAGHMTVHSGTYTSTGTSSAYAIYAYNVAAAIVDVEGGKFSGTTRELYKGSSSTVSISGGYYVHNTTVKDNCASNHHVLPASLTEGGITYNYKVAEAYTLTWNLDGGTVTTAGTQAPIDATGTPSGYVEKGASLTAPTVTKAGSVFNAWTPAVAATMPAANTTYTATWTEAVASVTVGGSTTYYTTLNAAFDYAKTQNNAEVTLLKDVVSTSTYTWSPSSAISNTFDLNGHSLSSTTGTVLGVGKAGATLTIKDTPGEGSISYSSAAGNWSPTVHVGNGKLILQGGTISRTANSDNAIGVQVYTTGDATPEFEMTGGKIQTSGGSSSYAVLTKSTGSNYAETTISGGEVSATATGTYAFALTAAQKGRITVKGTNNPRISASDATNATQVARNEGGGATLTIEGGLFKASHNSSPFSGTVSISGGYFNEYGSTTTYKTAIEGCTSDPKHPIELTAAEQAALGEGGTDYKYKVVDAYTLSWSTDGDALTGDYTTGYTEPGTTIVAPNTPTKTGYTFAAWTPAVAVTMPAANTTYTATWTRDTYTISYDLAGGSVASPNPTSYTVESGAITLNNPTKTGYTFAGWTGTGMASATMTVTIAAGSTGNRSYTATWTPNTNTAYTVNHYKQNVAGDGYDLADTDNLTGTTGAEVTPAVKSYEGFTAPSTQTVTVLADGSRVVTYNYTRKSYTLAWALDGGSVETPGTAAGSVKYGAPLTAPMVTKTGYTFAAWTPAVAATMPAANTTYTATWTRDNYTISYNLDGGSVASANPTTYNVESGAITLNNPTKTNYVFAGWTGTGLAEPTMTVTIPAGSTGNRSYTATWTPAVASVTIGGGTPDYFTTIDAAFDFANDQEANMEIKLLRDATAAASLTYTAAYNCTLDLNHHTLSGSVNYLITVNTKGKTFTIDDSSAEKDGTISMIGSGNARLQALYITAGTVNLKHGKIYSKNEAVYASNKSATAAAVYVADGQSFIMDDGTVESEAQYGSYAIYAYEGTSKTKTITIKGGLVKGHTNLGTTAAGIYARTTKLTVNGGTIIGHAWTSTAYGVYVRAGNATLNGGRIEATNDTISNKGTKTTYGIYARGPITIPAASTVNVYAKARTTTAAAVYVYATITGNTIAGGTFTAKAGTYTARGIHSEGDITISGGTFNVNAASPSSNANAPCGIYAARGTVTVEGNPTFNVTSGAARAHGAFAYGTIGDTGADNTKFSGTININGGTFNVTTTTTTAYGVYAGLVNKTVEEAAGNVAGTHYMPGIISITDGTFNVTATTNTACGIVLAAQQSETVGGVTTDRIPTATITGGKFNVVSTGSSSKAYAMNTNATNTALRVEGGWYSTKKMDDSKNMETKYTAPTKDCNYYCLETTAADKASVGSDYKYKVAVAYTLTWNLDGGTVTTAGTGAAVDATGTPSIAWGVGDAITAPTVTKTGYTFAAWTPAVAAKMPAANTTYTATWTPVARLTFTGATDNQWSKSSNWEPACVPTEAHDIYIQKPCSVDIEHAVAKSIVIDQSSSHTGKLNIGANKGLEVIGTISRTTTGEDNLSTRTEDLILETSTAGNATLIFDNSNSNAATVDLYSKGYIDGSGTKNYQYIGVPVTEANAASNFYGSWMYSWGIKKNGAWGWVSVKNGASVYPWTGYCITQQEPTYYAIEGTLVPTTTKDITVPADENMVVGNSWTAPIDINALTTDDLEGLLANIYFFNTGVDKTGSGSEAEARYAGGTYVTVPIHAAPYKDGDDHINSMQGFFVKNTDKSNEGTLHLNYERHVRSTTRGSIIGDALHAPKHAQAEEPVVLKIKVSGENYDDKLLLLEREDFSTGFDNGWDGDKWDGNESALYLYTKDSEGTENSVSAIPELEGTVIGFRAGEDNSYTMYFDYLNSDEAIYLYDIEANTYTRIETGGIYWFMTNDNEKHDRFIITRKSPQIATGGGNVQSDDVQSTKARKLIIEDKMFIMVDGKLFDATGKAVK